MKNERILDVRVMLARAYAKASQERKCRKMKEALDALENGRLYTLDELKQVWFAAGVSVASVWPAIHKRGLMERVVGRNAAGVYEVKYKKVVG
jgi:hypothetical protein